MDNRERITEALEDGGPVTYAELEARSGVAPGSFGRVVGRMVEEGVIAKSDSNYHLPEQADADEASGGADALEETRAPSGIHAYCARCGTSHRVADKAAGETSESVHREALAAS